MNKKITNKKKRGFTLIELIIVIAIIAILSAIAIPKFSEIRQNANVSTDIANAKIIHSVVAQGIANNKIAENITMTSTASEIKNYIDVDKVQSKITGKDFDIEVKEGNIVISSDGSEVYPNQNGKFIKK